MVLFKGNNLFLIKHQDEYYLIGSTYSVYSFHNKIKLHASYFKCISNLISIVIRSTLFLYINAFYNCLSIITNEGLHLIMIHILDIPLYLQNILYTAYFYNSLLISLFNHIL